MLRKKKRLRKVKKRRLNGLIVRKKRKLRTYKQGYNRGYNTGFNAGMAKGFEDGYEQQYVESQ